MYWEYGNFVIWSSFGIIFGGEHYTQEKYLIFLSTEFTKKKAANFYLFEKYFFNPKFLQNFKMFPLISYSWDGSCLY